MFIGMKSQFEFEGKIYTIEASVKSDRWIFHITDDEGKNISKIDASVDTIHGLEYQSAEKDEGNRMDFVMQELWEIVKAELIRIKLEKTW